MKKQAAKLQSLHGAPFGSPWTQQRFVPGPTTTTSAAPEQRWLLLLLRPQRVPASALLLQIQAPDHAVRDLRAPLPCLCSRLTVCRRLEGSYSQRGTASKGNVPNPFHSQQLSLHQNCQPFLRLPCLCPLHHHPPLPCTMLELLLAEGPLHPQPAAPRGGHTGLQRETECSRGTAQTWASAGKAGGEDENLPLLAFDLRCCCRQNWGDDRCFWGGWLAVAERRVVMCGQQEMWFVSAACSPPADHWCREGVSLSEEPAESPSKKSLASITWPSSWSWASLPTAHPLTQDSSDPDWADSAPQHPWDVPFGQPMADSRRRLPGNAMLPSTHWWSGWERTGVLRTEWPEESRRQPTAAQCWILRGEVWGCSFHRGIIPVQLVLWSWLGLGTWVPWLGGEPVKPWHRWSPAFPRFLCHAPGGILQGCPSRHCRTGQGSCTAAGEAAWDSTAGLSQRNPAENA